MPVDFETRIKQKASRYNLSGVDRGSVRHVPGQNCRYDWHEFENGDYCTISSAYREIWKSAKAAAYMYAKKSGKGFHTAEGSHELLIWRQDFEKPRTGKTLYVPTAVELADKRTKTNHAYVSELGDVHLSADGTILQRASTFEDAEILCRMYALSQATTPQDYKVF